VIFDTRCQYSRQLKSTHETIGTSQIDAISTSCCLDALLDRTVLAHAVAIGHAARDIQDNHVVSSQLPKFRTTLQLTISQNISKPFTPVLPQCIVLDHDRSCLDCLDPLLYRLLCIAACNEQDPHTVSKDCACVRGVGAVTGMVDTFSRAGSSPKISDSWTSERKPKIKAPKHVYVRVSNNVAEKSSTEV
jgi:hypothetical protein